MKIRKLQLKNIGVFEDETIEFKPCPAKDKAEIHILTGENGTGKTTILHTFVSLFDNYKLGETPKRNDLYKRFRANMEPSYFQIETNKSYVATYSLSPNQKGLSEQIFDVSDFDNDIELLKRYLSYDDNPTVYNDNYVINFAAFAYSGYRRIYDVPIEINIEKQKNPLLDALDFIKSDDNSLTINQWLGENLINKAIQRNRGNHKEVVKIRNKIDLFESILNNIVFGEDSKESAITFDMISANKLIVAKDDQELDFDVLPDGLKSLISWIGDLLMRLDSLKWKDDTPIFEREIILFLDEIEVHLHPSWQRKVLPVVQKLFKNAQIFVSTHSPFVVNSVDDAWVYKLKADEKGNVTCEEPTLSEDGYSYETVLREIFGVNERFGKDTQEKLDVFLKNSRKIFKQNGQSQISKEMILNDAKNLASQSAELQSIVFLELAKLSKKTGERYEI